MKSTILILILLMAFLHASPIVSLDSPADGDTVPAGTVDLQWTVVDPENPDTGFDCTTYYEYEGGSSVPACNDYYPNEGSYVCSVDLTDGGTVWWHVSCKNDLDEVDDPDPISFIVEAPSGSSDLTAFIDTEDQDVPLGQSITIDYGISELEGVDISSQFFVTLYDGSSELDSFDEGSITGGETLYYNYDYICESTGTHVISVFADSEDSITETNESNNDDSITINCIPPDLQVDGSAPGSVPLGDSFNLTYSLSEINNANIEDPFDLRVYENGVLVSTEDYDSFTSGSTLEYQYTGTCNEVGTLDYRIVVDEDDSILESDEYNNEIQFSVNCVDNSPPQIELYSPVDQTIAITNDPQVEFQFGVIDNSNLPSSCDLQLTSSTGSQTICSVNVSGNSSCSTSITSAGNYQWQLECVDSSGNSQSTTASFTVDMADGTISNVDLNNCYYGQTCSFIITLSNNNPSIPFNSNSLNVSVDSNSPSAISTPTFTSSAQVTYDWTCDSAGAHTLSLNLDPSNTQYETDESNNGYSYSFECLDQPPQVTLYSPSGTIETTLPATLSFNYEVSDDHSMNCTSTILGDNGYSYSDSQQLSTGNYSFQLTLDAGNYNWTLTCVDSSNQSSTAVNTFSLRASDDSGSGDNELLDMDVSLDFDCDQGLVVKVTHEGSPIEGARVKLYTHSGRTSGITDSSGEVTFSSYKGGPYKLYISKKGFKKYLDFGSEPICVEITPKPFEEKPKEEDSFEESQAEELLKNESEESSESPLEDHKDKPPYKVKPFKFNRTPVRIEFIKGDQLFSSFLDGDDRVVIRVSDADGNPLPNLPVWITSPTGKKWRAVTDDQGYLTLAGLDPGSYTVKIFSSKYEGELSFDVEDNSQRDLMVKVLAGLVLLSGFIGVSLYMMGRK